MKAHDILLYLAIIGFCLAMGIFVDGQEPDIAPAPSPVDPLNVSGLTSTVTQTNFVTLTWNNTNGAIGVDFITAVHGSYDLTNWMLLDEMPEQAFGSVTVQSTENNMFFRVDNQLGL